MRLPASNYIDANRFQTEIDRVIKRVPIVLGPSCEIPNSGDFKTINVAGTSLILTRTKDGKANALINVCSHRGACLTKKEKGNSNRFSCPYHGWNFSNSGELIAISSESDFGKIEKKNYGLKSLPVYESAGLIWAIMNPESEVDIPNFLS